MFIRRTATGTGPAGERYYTYRLVASERIEGKVRQRTLVNLGAHFAVEKVHWGLLCQCIDERLHGQSLLGLESAPVAVEAEAQRIAAQLLVQWQAPSSAAASGSTQTVAVDSMTLVRPRSVAIEQLALWAMAAVDFTGLLGDCGFNGPQRAAAVGTIIARMAAPGSEQATWRWLRSRSGLGELLAYDYETMTDQALYRIADRLYQHRTRIGDTLFGRVRDLFGLDCVVTLYDLTNTYFEGAAPGNPDAQRAHSKEKRSDCPLVTLGLVVMDRGIASQANIDWLADQGYRYLVVSRQQKRSFDADAATASHHGWRRARARPCRPVRGWAGTGRVLHSEARARKEQAIEARFAERFEAELQRIHDGLSRPQTTKRLDKLWERIGRLKEKSHGIGQYYTIELVPDDKGEKAVAVRWQRHAKPNNRSSHPGVYCLRTNETEWDAEQLWRTYIMLTDLEAVFRTLKSELGLRPIFHQKQVRSAGHLFITVLAYQFVQIIRRHLHEHGITDSWRSLRERMASQCRITATFRRADGRTLHVRKTTQPEAQQKPVYQALGTDPLPGGVQKTVV